jgi:hypothetical protein
MKLAGNLATFMHCGALAKAYKSHERVNQPLWTDSFHLLQHSTIIQITPTISMKFLAALTCLLVTATSPEAHADLIRGAKKDGQVSNLYPTDSFVGLHAVMITFIRYCISLYLSDHHEEVGEFKAHGEGTGNVGPTCLDPPATRS